MPFSHNYFTRAIRVLTLFLLFAWHSLLWHPLFAQNNALNFDGLNDNVIVNDNNALDVSSAFTIECWVYRTGLGHNTVISKWDDDADQRGWMLNFGEHDQSTLSVILTNNGQWSPAPYLQWNSGVFVPLNTWTHLAVTFNATGTDNVKVYKNGVLGGQTTWNFTVHTSSTNLFIGGYDGPGNGFNGGANSRFFAGSIDDLRIWNTTRTATEIFDNYICAVSPGATGLVALYDFNQGTAGGSNTGINTLTDGTANALNGTLTSFAKTGSASNFVAGVSAGVASVSIVSDDNDNALCNGTTATFTATGNAGGSGATYQWYRNSAPEGSASTSNTLTLTDLAHGDVVSCQMTSSLSCVAVPTVTSNSITISLLTTPTCDNGGVANVDCGCSCPPGFSGPTCATPSATTAQGLAFDGSGDYVYVGNVPVLAGGKTTLEAWVKINSYSPHAPIIKKGHTYWGLAITNTGKLEWANDYSPNSGTISAGSAVPLNTWTHVAVVVDGTSCKFYVNGILNGTNTISSFSDISTGTYIGYENNNGYFLNGSLDEVRVWNVVRSEGEIQTAMNTELTGTETGLKAYYKFNQTSGNTLADAVGCGLGSMYGFAMSGTTSNWATGATVNAVSTVLQVPDIDVSIGANNSTTHIGTHITGTPVDFTYTISNTGSGSVALLGSPYIVLSSGSGFSVLTQPSAASVAAGSPLTFVIRYTPFATSGTTSSTTFYIYSNDCDETYYYFTLTGTSCAMATPVATITTSDGDANVCSGFSETYTVSVQNPGNTLAYQWYENGSPVGTNSTTYTDASPLAGDAVYCEVTTTGTCVAQSPVNSNTITIAAITANPVCQNGGTVNASCGCDCPPGFTGSLCQTIARHGMAFDGSDDYLQVPHNSALNLPNGSFAIEAWVNLSSTSNQHTIASKGHGGGSYNQESFIFQVQYGSTLALYLGQNGSSGQWGYAPVAMQQNTWYHVAVSYSGGTATFYLDGNAVGTAYYSSIFTSDANPMFIGRQGYNCQCNLFKGKMDELRLWNTARSASEIADNRFCTVSPSASLVAYYGFDQGVPGGNNSSVTTFADASGNGRTATWYNFTKTGTTSNIVAGVNTGVASVSIVSNDNDNALCSSTTATFTATGFAATAGTTYQWYRGTSGTTAEGTASTSNTLTLTDLADGEKISCVMTSPVACLSSSTATSNQITISLLTPPTCANGGTPNADCGCSCPPGFSGPTCATVVPTTAQGLAFDQYTNNYVDIPYASIPLLTGTKATLEAWVKRDADGVYYTLFQKGYYNWGLGITDDGRLEWMNYYYPYSGVLQTSTSATVPVNDWTHVAAVVDGTSYSFYIDGQFVETVTGGSLLYDEDSYMYLGMGYYGNGLSGSLDEVRVWNVARTEAEIQASMNTEIPTTSPGLVAYYQFNQTSGTTLNNAVDCATGTLTNFTMSGTTSNWATGATLNQVSPPELGLYSSQGIDIATYGTIAMGAQPVNTTHDHTLTLKNNGSGTLNITNIMFNDESGMGYYTLITNPAPISLAAGQSTSVVVRLNTSNGITTYSTGRIFIGTNDCSEPGGYYYLSVRGIDSIGAHRGNMLHLDGSGDFVQCVSPSNLDFGPGDVFSGEAWVKTSNTTATTMQIFGKKNNLYGWGFSLVNGLPTLSFSNIGITRTYTGGSTNLADGGWHHLAFTSNMGAVEMYVDGYPQSVALGGSSVAGNTSHGIDFCIGAANAASPTAFFDGDIEEVRIWSSIRTQAEIRDKMHITLDGTENILTAYFQFNESTGNVKEPLWSSNGSLQGDAARPASTLSVAAGSTYELVVPSPGSYAFGTCSINFTAMSAPGSDEGFFVSELEDFPLNNVSGLPGTALSHWVIRRAGTQTFSYNTITVVLPVGTVISADDANNPGNFRLYKRETNSAGAWTEIGTGTSANIATRTVVFAMNTPLSSFSEFVAGSTGSTFPVEWLSFEAERAPNGNALLSWTTASEQNNAGFGVEASEDGQLFAELGFVAGAGNSSDLRAYTYTAPVTGASYFRLRQTDFNGSVSYSEVRYLANNQVDSWYFAPNPVRGHVQLHGTIPAGATARLAVYGADGRLLLDYTGAEVEAAANTTISNLSAGLYLFHLWIDGKSVVSQQMILE